MFCKITQRIAIEDFKIIPTLKTPEWSTLGEQLTEFWYVLPYKIKPEGSIFSKKMGLAFAKFT